MSDIDEVPDGLDLARGEADLSVATAQLRATAPPLDATTAAGRIRRAAHAAPRRTQMVRAAEPRRHLLISTSVITAVLHDQLAPALLDAAVRRVVIDVDPLHDLQSLTVELVVRYGVPVADDAARAHHTIEATLDDLLGPGRTSGPQIGHVHIVDVTTADPRIVDPADE
ncbi:hypothetical protein [Aeromicrobium sp. CF3.5]|uniref:hypothetical protein n=1 Tax=Aeromicrobium sp. CF3.5 TaxID=3373078 RepID=UPI003EE4C775